MCSEADGKLNLLFAHTSSTAIVSSATIHTSSTFLRLNQMSLSNRNRNLGISRSSDGNESSRENRHRANDNYQKLVKEEYRSRGYVQDARSSFCNEPYEACHLVVRMDMEMDLYGLA
ncbi:unnamed protein product [Vicia faba]|uniref:Uncharacterized protein n=1 Tax=Vicia faba TaxID=3906 RepID=A0AAV1ABQ2_VICFA|nr:unnamed protein product [Vicia faba]